MAERQRERSRASCDNHSVVLNQRVIIEFHRGRLGIQPDRGSAAKELQIQRVELFGGAQRQPIDVPFAGQQLLGQRRPVVGEVRLVPDQCDLTLESFVSQHLGGVETCQ